MMFDQVRLDADSKSVRNILKKPVFPLLKCRLRSSDSGIFTGTDISSTFDINYEQDNIDDESGSINTTTTDNKPNNRHRNISMSLNSDRDYKLNLRVCKSLSDINFQSIDESSENWPNQGVHANESCDNALIIENKWKEMKERKLKTATLVPVARSQSFAIDPALINKHDGLMHTLYYFDEYGSPKLRDSQAVVEEKKKKDRKTKFKSKPIDDDLPQCSCFSFVKLSKKVKKMCKLTKSKFLKCPLSISISRLFFYISCLFLIKNSLIDNIVCCRCFNDIVVP